MYPGSYHHLIAAFCQQKVSWNILSWEGLTKIIECHVSVLALLLWHHSNSWFVVVGKVEESHLLGIKQDLFSALVNGTSSPQPPFRLEGMNLK